MFGTDIKISNLGPINECLIQLNNMTLIVGQNNTGKTYLMNSLYYLQSTYFRETLFGIIKDSLENYNYTKATVVDQDIENLLLSVFQKLKHIDILSKVFHDNSTSQKSSFQFAMPSFDKYDILKTIQQALSGNEIIASVITALTNTDDTKANRLLRSLNIESNPNIQQKEKSDKILNFLITFFGQKQTYDIILKALLCDFFNLDIEDKNNVKTYLFPVERAGINKFFFESISKLSNVNLALKSLIEFKITLHNHTLKEKFDKSAFYEIARDLERKLFNGGKIHTEKMSDDVSQIIFYNNKQEKFSLERFSSSINELSIIILYLKYYAKKGDVIFIDEPELSLHPDSQRIFVKYISILSSMGLKFILITHSDYIVKEFNNLISLNYIPKDKITEINKSESPYIADMVIDQEKINLYSMYSYNNKIHVDRVIPDKFGFDEQLFAKAINNMETDSYAIFNLVDNGG